MTEAAPVRLAGRTLKETRHICAFFHSREEQNRLLMPFFKEGFDRGETIVRSLVTAHGGSVSARSKGLGRGSEFTLRLPAAPGPVAANRADAWTIHEREEEPEAGVQVLVVDDNDDAAEMLAAALASLGHRTRTAHDGPAALRICSEFMPAVALLDLGLPVMDGYSLPSSSGGCPGPTGSGSSRSADTARWLIASVHAQRDSTSTSSNRSISSSSRRSSATWSVHSAPDASGQIIH